MVERCLGLFEERQPARPGIRRRKAFRGSVEVLDLCCGSARIRISIAKLDKDAKVTCADVSAKA